MSGARWLGWGAAALAALMPCACGRGASSVRLLSRSPGDVIYRVSCKDDIRACRDEARRVCEGGYEVLESAGAPVEPPRVTSAPGPASTGPRYQRRKWIGQLVVACGRPAAGSTALEPSPPRAVAPGVATSPSAPGASMLERMCVPGVTQECLGPAACRGAHACLADGSGYGACDCGEPSARERLDAGTSSGAKAAPAE